jgi:hypothetical protein
MEENLAVGVGRTVGARVRRRLYRFTLRDPERRSPTRACHAGSCFRITVEAAGRVERFVGTDDGATVTLIR